MEQHTHGNDDPRGQPCYQVPGLWEELCPGPVFKKICTFCKGHFQVTGDFTVRIHIAAQPVHKAVDLLWHGINHPINAAVQFWDDHLEQDAYNCTHKNQCANYADSADRLPRLLLTLHPAKGKGEEVPFLEINDRGNQVRQHQADGNRLQDVHQDAQVLRDAMVTVYQEEKRYTHNNY